MFQRIISFFQVKVEIVVQFFKVGEIDTLKEQFNADVIVKAKWREPTLDGQQATVCVNYMSLCDDDLYVLHLFLQQLVSYLVLHGCQRT